MSCVYPGHSLWLLTPSKANDFFNFSHFGLHCWLFVLPLTKSTPYFFLLPVLLALSRPFSLYYPSSAAPLLQHTQGQTKNRPKERGEKKGSTQTILQLHSGCTQVIKQQTCKQTAINLKNNRKNHLLDTQRNHQKKIHQPCHTFILKSWTLVSTQLAKPKKECTLLCSNRAILMWECEDDGHVLVCMYSQACSAGGTKPHERKPGFDHHHSATSEELLHNMSNKLMRPKQTNALFFPFICQQ